LAPLTTSPTTSPPFLVALAPAFSALAIVLSAGARTCSSSCARATLNPTSQTLQSTRS
ncbi:hypothetical protein BV22DRAFT_1135894, partial [Leucogyrophana mollusca]